MADTNSVEFVMIFRMQGECAFLDGVPVKKNPWPLGTEEHKAWSNGWIEERERSGP